jgi:hypothetical protein
MANDKRRKEDERRKERDEAIVRALSREGRRPVDRFRDGSVRTTVWRNTDVRDVTVLVELYRYYSTWPSTGVSMFLEASDLIHALRGLSRADEFIKAFKSALDRPPTLPEEIVRDAVKRDPNPPKETFVHGNVAVNWFANPVYWIDEKKPKQDGATVKPLIIDYVTKVELLAVNSPGEPEPFIWSGQIPDARACLLDVTAGVERLHRSLRDQERLGLHNKTLSVAERGSQGARNGTVTG